MIPLEKSDLKNISLNQIIPDPNQPRNLYPSLEELTTKADAGDKRAQAILDHLTELSTSILEVGLQQPISVYPADNDDHYIIKDGHRRWLAMQLLARQNNGHYNTIECYIQPNRQAETETLLSQLNANNQREDLNVFELARSAQKLKDHLQANGGTVALVHEDSTIETVDLPPNAPDTDIWTIIERKMGIKQSRRYQIMQVLKLPPRIQRLAEDLAVPESRLRYVVPLKDEKIQEIIIREIAEKNLSNAAIKKRIEELLATATAPPPAAVPKPMQIESAVKPVRKLFQKFKAVHNIQAAISDKDPRTVESYRQVMPQIEAAIEELQTMLDELEYLKK
jgi:ParB/RepB/Spo0J family partition protein